MTRQIRLRLDAVLLIFALAAGLPAVAIWSWHLLVEWDYAVESAQKDSLRLVETVSRDLWGAIRDYREVAIEMARRSQLQTANSNSCDPILRDYAVVHDEVAAITVRNLSGELICSSLKSAAKVLPPAQMPILRRTVESGDFVVSDVQWGPGSGRWVLPLTYPIRDNAGHIQRVLFFSIDLVKYSKRILSDLPAGAAVSIEDQHHRTAMYSDNPEKWIGTITQGGNDELVGSKSGTLISSFTIEPLSGWVIQGGFPRDQVLGPYRDRMAMMIEFSSLISFIFITAIILTAHKIASPLRRLTEKANEVANGHLAVRAELAGYTEVRDLAYQFNQMLDVIETDVKNLRAAEIERSTLSAIVESSFDAIISKTLDGTVTSWNMGASRLLGYQPDEMIGKSINLIVPPDRENEEKHILAVLRSGQPIRHLETVRVTKGNKLIDVSITSSPICDGRGVVIGASKIMRDISERVQANLRLRSIIELSPVPYAITDDQQNTTYINKAFTRVFGYEIEDVRTFEQWTAKLFPDVQQFAELKKIRREYLDILEEGRLPPPLDLTITAKDGSVRQVIGAIALLPHSQHGERMICIQDITDVKAAQERLRESQKMEAFGQLAGGIAHDFNNILGIINTSTELLRDQSRRQEDVSSSTSLILRACQRGADLTKRLLIFSRKSTVHPTKINVAQTLLELIVVLRRTLGSHISVEFSQPDEDYYIVADSALFYTALYNLAINARDAMPRGGTLTFQLEREFVTAEDGREKPTVVISVSDTGTGLSREIAKKVFDPFFTTKDPGKGTGLGLSMVYGFMKEANGTVQVRSALGKGATFTLRFPASDPSDMISSSPSENFKQAKSLRILLLEDDDDLREAASIKLRMMGHSLEAAASTREALALVEGDNNFDVLITDFRLSEPKTGAEFARELESRLPHILTIVTSGYLSPKDANSLDPDWPLLQKPVAEQDLKRALHKITQ